MGSKPITQRAKCNYTNMSIQPEVTVDAAGKQRANFPSSAPRSMAKFLPSSGLVSNEALGLYGFKPNQDLMNNANTGSESGNTIKVTVPGQGGENEGENSTTSLDSPTTTAGVYERAGRMRRNYMAQSRQQAKGMEGKARREYMQNQRKKSKQLKHKYIGDQLGTWDINQ